MVASLFATLVCLGVAYALWTVPAEPAFERVRFWFALLPLAIILVCALFVVRGYSITNNALLIDRLLWPTRISLDGLQEIYFDPDATRGSVRTFGNGGFFSFTGRFRNKQLGSYRAFMTDRRRTVVLRFSDSVAVISPDQPEDFVKTLSLHKSKG
jgi:hypothetical protein